VIKLSTVSPKATVPIKTVTLSKVLLEASNGLFLSEAVDKNALGSAVDVRLNTLNSRSEKYPIFLPDHY